MICGQPAEAGNNFCKRRATPSHLPESRATGKRHRKARRYNNVQQRYREFLATWRNPDPDRPEVAIAKEFLAKVASSLREELARKLAEMEKKYNAEFKAIFEVIQQLTEPPEEPERKPIGFTP